jgi:hypothetical protein
MTFNDRLMTANNDKPGVTFCFPRYRRVNTFSRKVCLDPIYLSEAVT